MQVILQKATRYIYNIITILPAHFNLGFAKTASKSFTKAMEILGYKVGDIPQALEYFMDDWMDYMDGKCGIETMIQKYDAEGFDVTSDLPFNGLALDAFQQMEDCKIILTVRDNEDVWLKSFRKHYLTQATRHGIYVGIIESFLWCKGIPGSILYKTARIRTKNGKKFFC